MLRKRRELTTRELVPDFGWREVACPDEDRARAEAERQQYNELDDGAEWIYLHSDETGQWLARRVPKVIPKRPPSRWEHLLALLGF